MKIKSKACALLVAMALLFSLVAVKPAAAADAGEITLYVVGGLAIFVGLVLVGTVLTRDEAKMFAVEPQGEEGAAARDGLEMGPACRRPDGSMALVCW